MVEYYCLCGLSDMRHASVFGVRALSLTCTLICSVVNVFNMALCLFYKYNHFM